MSVRFLRITCDCCSFRGDSLECFGDFNWLHEGQYFEMERQMGVCRNCEAIVAMEVLPDDETMRRAREIRATYTGPRVWAFFEKDAAKCMASQEGFDVLEQVMALQRPPVCLTCGSSAVDAIKVPEGAQGDTPIDLGMGHPNCPGRLRIQGSGGMRIAMYPLSRFYDIHGQLVVVLDEYTRGWRG